MRLRAWIHIVVGLGLLLSPWAGGLRLSQPVQAAPAGTIRYVKPGAAGTCSAWDDACELQYALTVATAGDEIWVQEGVYKPTNGITHGSCQEIRDASPHVADGDYLVQQGGNVFQVYCADMDSTPVEYLTLRDSDQNFAQYTATATQGTDVRTKYSRVRLLPGTLQIDISDQRYSSSTGSLTHGVIQVTSMPYGVALDCIALNSAQGVARIDLRGTPLMVSDTFMHCGWYPGGTWTFSAGNQVVDLTGGGYCGYVQPASPACMAEPFNGTGSTQPILELGYLGPERRATFQLVSGVAIYGGFAGSETSRDDRDWTAHETILSGDIGAPGDSSDNSYHVVTGSGTDAAAVLDGFTITGGNADGDTYNGGGMVNVQGSPTLRNLTFSDNRAEGNGGAMYNQNNSCPVLTNCRFANNVADSDHLGGGDGGGMYNELNSSPVLSGTHFLTNTANRGGGMHNGNWSSPTLTNVTFSGNTANGGDGGGMHNNPDSSPELTDVDFIDNTATVDGGGMSNGRSNPKLANVTFDGNTAGNRGGAMYNWRSSPTLTECTFINNTATVDGGAMANRENSNSMLTAVTFSGNQAAGHGGGMSNWQSSPTLTDVTFVGDSATESGGAMYNDDSSPPLTQVTLTGNSARTGGGMYNVNNSNPTGTDVTFSDNTATDTGGGMYNDSSSPVLIRVTFNGNSSSTGGGMYNTDSSNPTLTDCTFSSNTAQAYGYPGTWGPHGGGIASYNSSPVLTNVTFNGNSVIVELQPSTKGRGGGMYSYVGSPELTGVTFSDNSADGGGGLSITGGSPTLTVVIFIGNSAHYGGGMYSASSSPALTNVTFRNNIADALGGGIYNWRSSPTLANVELSGNAAGSDGGGVYNEESRPALTDTTFITNTAESNGGGMSNSWGSTPDLERVDFIGNEAGGDGGGMHSLLNSNPTLMDVRFTSNSAGNHGGGMYNDNNSSTLTATLFISNSAVLDGGGMYNHTSSSVLTATQFIGNSAGSDGGGMYNHTGSSSLIDVAFRGNDADRGGGMYNEAIQPTLVNASMVSNTATHGGGMYTLDCFGTNTPRLVNVLFNANAATDPAQGGGGGMYNQGSSPELVNVTFAHNSAQYGGGMANFPHSVTSNPALRNSLLWGNTGTGTLYAQQVFNADPNNQPYVQGSTIQSQAGASPFVDADGADNVPGNEDDDLRPTYPSYGIVDGGGDDLLPADEFDLDGDGDQTEKLSLDLAGNARIYADYDFDGQADDPAVLGTDGIDQVDQGAYEAGCHPWHMQMGDPLLADGRKYRTGFHSDLVEVDPGETISGTLESYASQQAGEKLEQARLHYEWALACAETVTQTQQALLGLQNVLWEQATAAMLRGNEEMVGALDVTVSGGVGSIEQDIAGLERAAGLYDQATDGYLRASRDFPQFLASLRISRTLPITYTEVFTQVDVQRLAMAAAKMSRATLELGELQFRNGEGAQAGGTLAHGYSEGLLELNLLVSLWPGVAETVDYVTLVQNLGGMDRLYSYLQSGKNPFGYGPEFAPFHYRPDKDPERGSNNFEHTRWIADELYLAPAIADATQAEAGKRMFDDDYTTFQAKLNDVESTYDSELEVLCGTAGNEPDLNVCDGGTIQEQYEKVLGAKLRVEQVLVQMEMNNAKIGIEQQRAADLCAIEVALAQVMLENGEELAILSEQEAGLRFAKSQSQGILGVINGCISGAFGGAGGVGEMKAAPGLSFAMAGLGALWGGLNAYLDWKFQEQVAEQIGDVYAKKERIYALEKAEVHYANCDKVQAESLAHLKTIVLEFANLEMEHAIAMNELMQALSRLNGLTSRAEYLLAEKAKARAFTQLLYQDPAGRVLRNHLMEQAYFSFEQALQYGFRAGRALDYEINNDVPYSGYPNYPLRTLDDLYAINSTDELADGLLQMSQAWETWTQGRFPESRTAIVYLSRALFEDYPDPTTGETVTAREQFNAFIRGRTDPDALTLHFETSILQGNKFVPTWYYNDRIDSIKMRVRGQDLSLCPQPPQYVDVNLRQAGTSFIRTEDATLKRVGGRIQIDVEDIREYDLEPKSVSVQAAVNDGAFPDPGGTIRGLKSRSVAFADWELTIDTTQGAENPCLNLDHVDEIELHIVRQAYDLPLPPGSGPEEEELLAAFPVPEYEPSRKVLPSLTLSVTTPEWTIPGLGASSGPVNLDAAYVGTIVISQPLYLPPVDLALVLRDDGGNLSGTISPTLSYPVMPGTGHGPALSGAWSGAGFSLESEVFTTVITTGVVISHQVLLHTGIISDSGGVLSGVYSETLAGLTPEPLVTVGEFWLVRPHAPTAARIYLPLVMRSTP